MIRAGVRVARALTTALLVPGAVLAQASAHTSAIVGVVIEAGTEEPIAGVSLELNDMGRAVTSGADGAFAFEDLPPGTYELMTGHLEYGDVAAVITVPVRRSVRVEVRLSIDPIEVDPIRVLAVRDSRLERSGFYERREWGEARGAGQYVDGEEIATHPHTRLGRLVASLSGVEAPRSPRSR